MYIIMCFYNSFIIIYIFLYYYFYYFFIILFLYSCALFQDIIRGIEYFYGGPRRVRYCIRLYCSWKNCCASNFILPIRLLLSPSSQLQAQLLIHVLIKDRLLFLPLTFSLPKPTVRLLVSSSWLLVWTCYCLPCSLATPSSGSLLTFNI